MAAFGGETAGLSGEKRGEILRTASPEPNAARCVRRRWHHKIQAKLPASVARWRSTKAPTGSAASAGRKESSSGSRRNRPELTPGEAGQQQPPREKSGLPDTPGLGLKYQQPAQFFLSATQGHRTGGMIPGELCYCPRRF